MHAPVCTILVIDPLLLRHLSQVGIPIRAQRQCHKPLYKPLSVYMESGLATYV